MTRALPKGLDPDYHEQAERRIGALLHITKLLALKTSREFMAGDERFRRSITISALTAGAMGFLPVLSLYLMDGDQLDDKDDVAGFPGKLTQDDILFAALYIAFTETATKEGRVSACVADLIDDPEEAQATIQREVKWRHQQIAEAFEKIKGYRYPAGVSSLR